MDDRKKSFRRRADKNPSGRGASDLMVSCHYAVCKTWVPLSMVQPDQLCNYGVGSVDFIKEQVAIVDKSSAAVYTGI